MPTDLPSLTPTFTSNSPSVTPTMQTFTPTLTPTIDINRDTEFHMFLKTNAFGLYELYSYPNFTIDVLDSVVEGIVDTIYAEDEAEKATAPSKIFLSMQGKC